MGNVSTAGLQEASVKGAAPRRDSAGPGLAEGYAGVRARWLCHGRLWRRLFPWGPQGQLLAEHVWGSWAVLPTSISCSRALLLPGSASWGDVLGKGTAHLTVAKLGHRASVTFEMGVVGTGNETGKNFTRLDVKQAPAGGKPSPGCQGEPTYRP